MKAPLDIYSFRSNHSILLMLVTDQCRTLFTYPFFCDIEFRKTPHNKYKICRELNLKVTNFKTRRQASESGHGIGMQSIQRPRDGGWCDRSRLSLAMKNGDVDAPI